MATGMRGARRLGARAGRVGAPGGHMDARAGHVGAPICHAITSAGRTGRPRGQAVWERQQAAWVHWKACGRTQAGTHYAEASLCGRAGLGPAHVKPVPPTFAFLFKISGYR